MCHSGINAESAGGSKLTSSKKVTNKTRPSRVCDIHQQKEISSNPKKLSTPGHGPRHECSLVGRGAHAGMKILHFDLNTLK